MTIKHSSYLPPEMLRIFETLPHPYLILSKELYMLTASDAYLKLVGKPRTELIEKYIFDIFPKIPGSDIAFSLERVLETLKPHELPITRFDIPDPNDKTQICEHYWSTTHTPVLNTSGDINYIIHHTQNVTAQVLAERSLKTSLKKETLAAKQAQQLNRQMENIFKEIPAQIAILSGPDLVYEFVNPQYQKELFPNREILGKSLLEVLPEVAEQPLWNAFQHVYKTGETYAGKEMCIPLTSTTSSRPTNHYFNFIFQAIKNEKGAITSILIFQYEITELVMARKRLEQSKKELLALNNNLAQANEEIQVSSEEIQSANEELRATNEELHEAQQSLLSLNNKLEERVGSRTLELLTTQAEASGQRDRLKRFFMQAPAGICILDGPDLIFELVNPAYQKLFPGRELTGKPMLEALPELKDLLIADILKNVYQTGNTFEGKEQLVPVVSPEGGPAEDRYFNFIYQARHDADEKVDGILVFAFEITEIVLTRQKEWENEQRFRFLLNAMPQQVWTALPDGKLDYVNEIVTEDFGQSAEEILGHGWHVYIHQDDLKNCLRKWVTALQTGNEYMAEFRLKFHDGQYHWHLARAIPLIENGEIKLWVGTSTNIDEQKANEEKKDEFISIASHELKTPLTSIKAFNQLMMRINDPQKLAGLIQKSAAHVLRLEKLISDLLDVTRINAGKMIYNMETFSFMEMLTDSIESMQHTTPTHQIILENAEDVMYTGDRFRLEQVINNLLTNAIKYSPEADKIIINCLRHQDSLIVSVQDFGIGIEERNLNRLFDRYYRVDNTAMRFEGLGLGLFISSEILKRHKGSFWIESVPGEGSIFFFRLLLNPAKKQAPVKHGGHYYKDSNVTIIYNKAYNRIDADWTGFQSLESIQRGCLHIQDMLVKNNVYKILNDNSNVLGNWSEAADWAAQEWLPAIAKAGLRYFAWVYSSSAFSRLSARKSVSMLPANIIMRFFTDTASAETWINQQ